MTDETLPAWTMRCPDGSLRYPGNEDDARDFAADDGAVPLDAEAFPFDITGVDMRRALVTITFELRSRGPLEVSENHLWSWVADRMGRVTDNGPHGMRPPDYVDGSGVGVVEVDFGFQYPGPVVWLDGSAPEHGFHCGECRDPKVPDAGPCLRTVAWGSGTRPCQSDDAQHHGRCWHQQILGPVPLSGGVA